MVWVSKTFFNKIKDFGLMDRIKKVALDQVIDKLQELRDAIQYGTKDGANDYFDEKDFPESHLEYARGQVKAIDDCDPYLDTLVNRIGLNRAGEIFQKIKDSKQSDIGRSQLTAQAVQSIESNKLTDTAHWCLEAIYSAIHHYAMHCPQCLIDGVKDALLCRDPFDEGD